MAYLITDLPTYLLTYLPAHLLLEVARHRFAREGRTQVLKLLWLNHEGATLLCPDQASSAFGQLALRRPLYALGYFLRLRPASANQPLGPLWPAIPYRPCDRHR